MTISEGRRIHSLAEKAREDGNPLMALIDTDKAIFAYRNDGDLLGLSEVLASRAITLRHLFQNTDDRAYLIMAKNDCLSAVQIAQESGDRTALALPLFELANTQEALGVFNAVITYREAVDAITNYPPEQHDRPAVKADFCVHLATCEYKAGDHTALERAEEALRDLESAEEPDSYAKDVWISGGYMRIADMLQETNPEKAREYLQRAKEIIDANPALKKRREQWEKLAKRVV